MMKNMSLGRIQFQIFETTRPNKQRVHLHPLHPIVWRHCSFYAQEFAGSLFEIFFLEKRC